MKKTYMQHYSEKTWGEKALPLPFYLALLCFTGSLFLVLFLPAGRNYYAKNSLAAYSGWYILGGAIIGLVGLFVWHKGKTLHPMPRLAEERHFRATLMVATVLLYVLQQALTQACWFRTGWDVNFAILATQSPSALETLYSIYPNNLFLVGVFRFLAAPFALSSDGVYRLCIAVGGLVAAFACLLTACAAKKLSHSRPVGYAVFFIEALYIVLSPMVFLLPYTDTYGLLAPALLLFFYASDFPPPAKAFGVVLAGVLGWYMKPNAIIPLVAVLAVELWHWLCNRKNTQKNISRMAAVVLASGVALVAAVTMGKAVQNYGARDMAINPQLAFSPAHYLMMGWNFEGGGGYNQGDIDFSKSIPVYQDRVKANLSVFYGRVQTAGLRTIRAHLINKTLSNFSDGTGGWGVEGGFFLEQKGESAALQKFFGIGYERVPGPYQRFAHLVWMFLLVGISLNWVNRKPGKALYMVAITLLGQSLFLLLFECRARYFIQLWPYFVVLAVMGWRSLYSAITAQKQAL